MMHRKLAASIFSTFIVFLAPTLRLSAQTVTDIDGNVYNTVQIGDQLWMAENLRTSRYADGTAIPNVTGDAEWTALNTGAWAHYDNNASNETPYGKLYNWYAVVNAAGLCPSGWRVPSVAEWTTLSNYLGGADVAGGKMKATGTDYWQSPNTGATNESGFSALPGGIRYGIGSFVGQGFYTFVWSSSEYNYVSAFYHHLYYDSSRLVLNVSFHKRYGFSVRCLRDSIDPLTLSDVEVAGVASTSATARSQVLADGGSSVTRRGAVWGATADVSLADNLGVVDDDSTGTGAFEVEISGLSASTTYHMRAFAINAASDTAYSAAATFITKTEVTVTDIDGNVYTTVQIGEQLWMAENLRTSRYADGTAIPNVTGDAEWAALNTGAWAHYDNNASNETPYGKLYNGYAVVNAAGLCPSGWRVPSDAEWTTLSNYLGGADVAGGKMKATGTDYWQSPNTGATNESGFSALPGGHRLNNGLFGYLVYNASFWSSSEASSDYAWARYLDHFNSDLKRDYDDKRLGFSVRCLRDSIDPLTLSDVEVAGVASTSATARSQVLADGGSSVTRRGAVWGATADVSLADNLGMVDDDSTGTGAFEVEISGLSASTTYHMRAFAINAAADTAYSAAATFTTKSAVTVTDIDGNVYTTVQIGDQEWMAENLRTSRYADGTAIPNVTGDAEWAALSTGAWAHYLNNASNETPYGKLYNWHAVADSRGLCPSGWRVPSEADWTQLSDFLGGEGVAGGKMKATGTDYWQSPNTGATNESGFSALPGGGRFNNGSFNLRGNLAYFWSSTELSSDNAWTRLLFGDYSGLHRGNDSKSYGFSVRCLRDSIDPTPPTNSLLIVTASQDTDSADLTLGLSELATIGEDEGLDTVAPPPPPSGTFDARLRRGDTDYFTDVQPSGAMRTEWEIRVSPGTGGGDMVLSWDPDIALPGSVRLLDAINGSFVNLDMRSVGSVTLPSFVTTLTVVQTLEVSRVMAYDAGWNLVGMPVMAPHDSYMELYAHAIAGQLYKFGGSYQAVDTMSAGMGYWLRLSQAGSDTLTGLPVTGVSMAMGAGWNLIGGITDPVAVASIGDPGSVLASGPVYGFNGAYVAVDTLMPGYGYWIRTTGEGVLDLGDAVQGPAKRAGYTASPDLSGFDRVAFLSSPTPGGTPEGSELTSLYFAPGSDAASTTDPQAFVLPPLPPAGLFDARYADQSALSNDHRVEIRLQQGASPVWVRVETGQASLSVVDGAGAESRYRVSQWNGPLVLTQGVVAAGEAVGIHPEATRLEIAKEASEAVLPQEYRLEANYPNPFNPSTQIRFALPKAGDVRLEVFDATGRRVAVLVDGPMPAGFHAVEFDARTLSSGTYFYRMSAGGYVDVRAMSLLK